MITNLILTIDTKRIALLAVAFMALQALYYLYVRKIVSFYEAIVDSSDLASVLQFQIFLYFLALPLIWLFVTALMHYSAVLLGGTGKFGVFLLGTLYVSFPAIVSLAISLNFFLPALEQELYWRIQPGTDTRGITELIDSSSSISSLRTLFYTFYFLTFIWMLTCMRIVHKLNWLIAGVALALPFVLIYLCTMVIPDLSH